MSWSLGEVRTLGMKAARGCGLSWGLAEEAGFAVSWLEARRLPGTQALATYLDEVEQSGYATAECPIAVGASISDTNSWDTALPGSIFQPLLIVPFLAAIAGNRTLELTSNQGSVAIGASGICSECPQTLLQTGPHRASCSEISSRDPSPDCTPRVADDRAAFIADLGRHASKTYAPATEASRLTGAGAGLDDND